MRWEREAFVVMEAFVEVEVWLDRVRSVHQARSLECEHDLGFAFTESLIAARCNLAVAVSKKEEITTNKEQKYFQTVVTFRSQNDVTAQSTFH